MKILYQAPDDRTIVVGPTTSQVADIFLRSDYQYWQQGGNGEAQFSLIREPTETMSVRWRGQMPGGEEFDFVAGQPSLCVRQPVHGGFFVRCLQPTGVLMTYDGSDLAAYVDDEEGGNPIKTPRACLVDKFKAVEIVSQFVITMQLPTIVTWHAHLALPKHIYET